MLKLLVKTLSRDVLPLLVATGALMAFALSYLAHVSPLFDFFAQFTAHWLTVAVVAVAASFVRCRAYAMLLAGPVLACLLPVGLAGWYALTPNAVQPKPITSLAITTNGAKQSPVNRRRRLKLMSFNIYNLNLDFDAVLGEIQRHDPDVVVLIEFGPNKRLLKEQLLRLYPHHKNCGSGWACTIGVFSRLSVHRFRLVTARADAGPPMISADIDMGGGRTVTVVATHIISPNHGPRANFIELDVLAAKVRNRRTPMIIAGDLNATIWSNAFDNFRRKSGLNHMGHLIPTWPAKPLALPQLGIDHVFTSPDLRLVEIGAGRAAGSDHIPLIAAIEMR